MNAVFGRVGAVWLFAVGLSVWLGVFTGIALGQGTTGLEQTMPGGTTASEATCLENEEQVETFVGSQDRTTEEFQITGPEWRFVSTIRPATVTTGSLEVDALNEDGFSEGFTTQIVFPDEELDRQSSGVIDGPGTFRLRIEANGVDYRIVVCQSQDGGGTTEPTISPEPTEEPTEVEGPPPGETIIDIPRKPLPWTGGPAVLPAVAFLLGLGLVAFAALRPR